MVSFIVEYVINTKLSIQEVCFPYWNHSTPGRYGELIIEVQSTVEENGFIRRELKISHMVCFKCFYYLITFYTLNILYFKRTTQ